MAESPSEVDSGSQLDEFGIAVKNSELQQGARRRIAFMSDAAR